MPFDLPQSAVISSCAAPGQAALPTVSLGIVTGAYAPQAYKRLAAVKHELDPHNLFRVNHNIPPAAA